MNVSGGGSKIRRSDLASSVQSNKSTSRGLLLRTKARKFLSSLYWSRNRVGESWTARVDYSVLWCTREITWLPVVVKPTFFWFFWNPSLSCCIRARVDKFHYEWFIQMLKPTLLHYTFTTLHKLGYCGPTICFLAVVEPVMIRFFAGIMLRVASDWGWAMVEEGCVLDRLAS